MSGLKINNNQVLNEVVRGTTVLVDVRERSEFLDKALEGAINIPLSEFSLAAFETFTDKKIVLICYSGNRSKRVAKRLLKEGGITANFVADNMEHFETRQKNNDWTIDRQFRMVLGILIAISLVGFNWFSPFFLLIPLILATGLILTSILNKCYMRMGIAILPWNKNRV